MSFRTVSILLLTVLVATACTTTTGVDSLRDREWKLVSIEGFSSMPAGVATPTIRFGSDGRSAGNTGCNSAGSDYTVEGDRLTFGMVMSTKRACVEENGNRLEGAYLQALDRTRRFRIAGGQLELLDESGAVLARFA